MNSAQTVLEMEVTEERYFSSHHLLLRTANMAVMEAQSSIARNRELHILTAMVMSALSVEALYNAIGYRVVPGWKDFEQISSWAKIRLICSVLNIDYDKGREPWQQLKKLLSFRNAIAHGKPETEAKGSEQRGQSHFLGLPRGCSVTRRLSMASICVWNK